MPPGEEDNWLLLELLNRELIVVSVQAVIQAKLKRTELLTGKTVMIKRGKRVCAAKIIMTSGTLFGFASLIILVPN